MRDVWQQRIDRAAELTRGDAAPLMTTYRRLLIVQRGCNARLRRHEDRLTGAAEDDLAVLGPCAGAAIAEAVSIVPERLAAGAPAGDAAIATLLRDEWARTSPSFYARLVLQPYAECLARLGRPPRGRPRDRPSGAASCPFCGGPPQLSILRSDSGANGGGRTLACALCATVWPIRRILCAQCGEEDERRLAYFHSPELAHLRVDACETCRHYLKTVDLTRLGRAVPMVDEVAGGTLDLWAVERGYDKIEVNLVGL